MNLFQELINFSTLNEIMGRKSATIIRRNAISKKHIDRIDEIIHKELPESWDELKKQL